MADFFGTNDADVIDGTSDADLIQGRGGDDTLSGLDGNDRINGQDGDDVIRGGLGADTLTGGRGSDVFLTTDLGADVFANQFSRLDELDGDVIRDFSAEDKLIFESGFGVFSPLSRSAWNDGEVELTIDELAFAATFLLQNQAEGAEYAAILNSLTPDVLFVYEGEAFEVSYTEDAYGEAITSTGGASVNVAEGVVVGNDVLGGQTEGFQDRLRIFSPEARLDNQGLISSTFIRSQNIDIENSGLIGGPEAAWPVVVQVRPPTGSTGASVTFENDVQGIVRGVTAARIDEEFFDGTLARFDKAVVTNAGEMTGTFSILRATARSVTIENSGMLRNDDVIGAAESGKQVGSIGIIITGEVGVLYNSGSVEVLRTDDSFVFPLEDVAVFLRSVSASTIVNSGLIASTGDAVAASFITSEARGTLGQSGLAYIHNLPEGEIIADTDNDGSGVAIRGAALQRNVIELDSGQSFEILNEGVISGDVLLYHRDFFEIVATFERVSQVGLSVPSAAFSIGQLRDDFGTLLFDANGDPLFPVGEIISTTLYGDVIVGAFDPTTGTAPVTDLEGNPVFGSPRQALIDEGSFDDVVTNAGTIDGLVDLGIGDDTFMNTGVVTGPVNGGDGDDLLMGA